MNTQQTERSFLYYLNPFLWIQEIFSYIMTFFLLFNRFFAVIFGCFVVIFVALFLFDRYCEFTYGDENFVSNSSCSVALLTRASQYRSPFSETKQISSTQIARNYTTKKVPEKNVTTKENVTPSSRSYTSIQKEVRRRAASRRR